MSFLKSTTTFNFKRCLIPLVAESLKLDWFAGPLVTTLTLTPSLIFFLNKSPQWATLFSVKKAENITIYFFAFSISFSKIGSNVFVLNTPVFFSSNITFGEAVSVGFFGRLKGPKFKISLISIIVPLLCISTNIFLKIEVSCKFWFKKSRLAKIIKISLGLLIATFITFAPSSAIVVAFINLPGNAPWLSGIS